MKPKALYRLLAAMVLMTFYVNASAVDGCKVLLCFAGNWKDISQCRPEVEQALKDQAKGKGWPTCGKAGPGNGVEQKVLFGPTCPFHLRQWQFVPNPAYNTGEGGTSWDGKVYGTWRMTCQAIQVLDVQVNGMAWKKSFVLTDGSELEEWQPAAVQAMPQIAGASSTPSPQYAAWLAAGSPKGTPALPENYINLGSSAYQSCYPYSEDMNTCNWYDAEVYQP